MRGIMKTETTEESKRLVIALAKSLKVDFPKDKICKDCAHYDHGDDRNSSFPNQHSCWEKHKITTRPPDLDDMCRCDYVDPHVIENLDEAMTCPYYASALEKYKKLYEETKQELDKLKSQIRNLVR